MCRGSFIGGLILAVILAAAPAEAQSPKIRLQVQPKVNMPPRVLAMPPAAAGKMALRLNPGATLLKINPLQGKGFNVTIKKGNAVKQVFIPNQ